LLGRSLAHHLVIVVLVNLLNALSTDGRQPRACFLGPDLSHLADLQQVGDVRVDALLLEEEVMGFLEVDEGEIILAELAHVEEDLARDVELNATTMGLLVLLEHHVHEHF